MNQYTYFDSPIGKLLLVSDGKNLNGLYMDVGSGKYSPGPSWSRNDELAILHEAGLQLAEYFQGKRQEFDLPLQLTGTQFQLRVWEELRKIPYGTVISYGHLAGSIGKPKAFRAVGLANGKNPVSIIVPCHRVIGSNGTLTGYGGGLPRKEALLSLERAHQQQTGTASGYSAKRLDNKSLLMALLQQV